MENIIFNSDEKVLIFEYLYTVENYITFCIKVKSGKFSGASNFCISKDQIIVTVQKLSELYNKLTGFYKLSDYDSDAYITFEMHKLGHMNVFGQIGGSHEDHFMKFKYMVDQTVLINFIQALEIVL
jgi:hypothetical protein